MESMTVTISLMKGIALQAKKRTFLHIVSWDLITMELRKNNLEVNNNFLLGCLANQSKILQLILCYLIFR